VSLKAVSRLFTEALQRNYILVYYGYGSIVLFTPLKTLFHKRLKKDLLISLLKSMTPFRSLFISGLLFFIKVLAKKTGQAFFFSSSSDFFNNFIFRSWYNTSASPLPL
jgi:hypothetical protein